MYKCNSRRLRELIEQFSQFGATENGGVTRLSLSDEDVLARNYFCECCEALGMDIHVDDMGNIYATLAGKKDVPPIVMGSHLDSVEKGGRFDGVLGILTAIEAIRTIKENEIEVDIPLMIVNFTNEEGARFDPAMMSSGVITSKFDKEKMLQSTDKNGVRFHEALQASGYEGEQANRLKEALAYIELHIEQGPVLEAKQHEIGVVEGVLGMVCYEITITGQSNHAGTTPMTMRKDPMIVASTIITELHEQLGKIDEQLVFTFGRLNVSPNIHTVIPNQVTFTIDSRHQNPEVMEQVEDILLALPETAGGCNIHPVKLWGRETVYFDTAICNEVERACQSFGYTVHRMFSGAGHDAQYMASMVPSAMIFVPSIQGKSHCEEEKTTFEDCAKGADILLETVLTLQTKFSMGETYTLH
ncbi:Zn-dependent hydrolase [Lysinibacillus sp. FSL M8-0216]|uniref:N-carbamoyl-L-amino-acid hydrolase n=1 Tax=Lysinibacillus fusiformis TaxID=28031 RepID=A0A1H9N718_9BACI|nr:MULTISPECIES: Zn-dependent hydrolase [Lysinibacillus]MCG7434509.1 Zn-dependent hydrolase [Lysinibacillus fusiformis]MED4671363.1 Zn-dependent hydrolase [Lysinibacillus fusiformis]QAS55182.1 Zn-dependent hydrolase [Lysinibacillus sphaericus]RDV33401.1 Zn-dependent hydrolase [Lysinibacillus fusiformis]SCY63793.1 N-carbamoyl-L-amino-acid hydrolase [Lysinibacillus fusiformis]